MAQTAAEYRNLARHLRAQAQKGGGVVQYMWNGKMVRRESIKDLLAAAEDMDAKADRLEGLTRGALRPVRLVARRG